MKSIVPDSCGARRAPEVEHKRELRVPADQRLDLVTERGCPQPHALRWCDSLSPDEGWTGWVIASTTAAMSSNPWPIVDIRVPAGVAGATVRSVVCSARAGTTGVPAPKSSYATVLSCVERTCARDRSFVPSLVVRMRWPEGPLTPPVCGRIA
jgi:hypothetical protein